MKFKIDINPVAKQRARITYKKGKVFSYTPERTKKAEEMIKFAYYNARDKFQNILNRINEPLIMKLTFAIQKPKNMEKKYKNVLIPHIKRPDLDNLIKLVKDALNGVAYSDDSQIYKIEAKKYYADKGYIIVEITTLEQEKI